MSRWNDQFQSHAFRNTWNSLKAVLGEEDLEKNGIEAAIKEIARLRKVTAYVDSVLEQIDPELIPLSHLDGLNQHASNCFQQVNTFKGNQNIGHLHNANTHADSVIVLFSQTPFALLARQGDGLAHAANAYASTLDQHLNRLNQTVNNEIETVKTQVASIQANIAEEKKSLDNLNAQITTVAQTIQAQTAEFNTQFQANEKTRTDKFETAATKLQQKADDEFRDVATKAGTILKVLGKFHDDAAKVFGVVVNTMQAGAYSLYANEEKSTANFLRWSAIILMILGVAVLVVPEVAKIMNNVAGYTLDWKVTLGRVPFSLILFVPAFYLARESSKHRNNEILNRRRELILSTIDPYLALLDEKKAEEIKVEIAKGIFSEGNLPNEQTVGDSSNVIAQIANLVKQVRDK
jgi:hypothetical protein